MFYSESVDDPKQTKMEKGEGKYSPNTLLPFGYSMTASSLMTVVAVADALHCSVDYLLGRTDRMELVPDSDTGWRTGTPWNIGEYAVMIRWSAGGRITVEKMKWDGERWNQFGEEVEIFDDTEIFGWIELPEVAV